MARRSGSSGGRRQSLSTKDHFSNAVGCYKECELILETISRSVANDFPKYFNDETIQSWSDEIIDITLENEKLRKRAAVSEAMVEKSTFSNEDSEMSSAQALNAIHESIEKEMRGFDPNASGTVKKMRKTLKASGEEDDDVMAMDTGDKEADFNCPFTGTRMDVPMKNDACQHRISQAGFKAMFSRPGIPNSKCPMPGCKAKWTRQSASVDENMARRMDRFFRLHTGSNSSVAADAADLTYVDHDDDGYTQL